MKKRDLWIVAGAALLAAALLVVSRFTGAAPKNAKPGTPEGVGPLRPGERVEDEVARSGVVGDHRRGGVPARRLGELARLVVRQHRLLRRQHGEAQGQRIVVHGRVLDSSRRTVVKLIDQMWDAGAEGVILGCTELEMLIKQADSDLPVFPCTTLHVQAALDAALESAPV